MAYDRSDDRERARDARAGVARRPALRASLGPLALSVAILVVGVPVVRSLARGSLAQDVRALLAWLSGRPARLARNEAPRIAGARHLELTGEGLVRLEVIDPEGSPVTLRISAPPVHGTLAPVSEDVAADGWIYRADEGHVGADDFEVVARDGELESAPARIEIRTYGVAYTALPALPREPEEGPAPEAERLTPERIVNEYLVRAHPDALADRHAREREAARD